MKRKRIVLLPLFIAAAILPAEQYYRSNSLGMALQRIAVVQRSLYPYYLLIVDEPVDRESADAAAANNESAEDGSEATGIIGISRRTLFHNGAEIKEWLISDSHMPFDKNIASPEPAETEADNNTEQVMTQTLETTIFRQVQYNGTDREATLYYRDQLLTGEVLNESGQELRHEYDYDQQGKLKQLRIFRDGVLQSRKDYFYNSQGGLRKIEQWSRHRENILLLNFFYGRDSTQEEIFQSADKLEHFYYRDNRLLLSENYLAGSLLERQLYDYNAAGGYLLTWKNFTQNSEQQIDYDANGRMVQEKFYQDEQLKRQKFFVYQEDLLAEEQTIDAYSNKVIRYSYDSNGNLSEKRHYVDNQLQKTQTFQNGELIDESYPVFDFQQFFSIQAPQ